MAHTCYSCGNKCHCSGDIDDLIFENEINCTCCDNDDFDEDDYYYCHDCNKPDSKCEC